jgi:hypothetical protein
VHSFENQRYQGKKTGVATSFLSEYSAKLGQKRGFQSKGLMELSAYYINLMSYREVEKLVARVTKESVYKARNFQNKMLSLKPIAKEHLNKSYNGLQLCLNFVDPSVEVLDVNSAEVHYFDDAVGVKRQKEVRKDPIYQKKAKTVQTDIIVLQKPDKTYNYIAKTGNTAQAQADLEAAIRCHFSSHYAGQVLPFVAITDGATSIRDRIHRIFGENAIIILDWYHLRKKMREQMSRLGLKKEAKETHLTKILAELWFGNILDTLIYIEQEIWTTVKPDKRAIVEDLLFYLDKHKAEIIDYRTRYLLPKTIGSGRGEKANDQIVAIRQKTTARLGVTPAVQRSLP